MLERFQPQGVETVMKVVLENIKGIIELYGAKVIMRQVRFNEIHVFFDGGLWPDGDGVKRFPNMAEALTAVTNVATAMEAEESDAD